ncbi:cupredoxin domain-containing protein [Sphingomonas changnyeongensis]|uniref:methylamine utilization protein n=1 Tax=Sphingomonas changnyeongensis TaxID=2698679 RepID=UPI00191C0BCF|nr:methylamine utilization protein [Sphingomonas changnyeongensis]
MLRRARQTRCRSSMVPTARSAVLGAAAMAMLAAAPAPAADLDLRLVDSTGQPVPDAVMTFHPAGGAAPGPIRFPWPAEMVQENVTFVPHVLIVPVGATVRFPNRDKVRHHVYSFSRAARFEIKLFGRDETRSYTFTTPGAVALGCNIHDRMAGFIRVVDTPFAAKSDAGGRIRLAGLPDGRGRITIWHPRLKAKDQEMVLPHGPGAPARAAGQRIVLQLGPVR